MISLVGKNRDSYDIKGTLTGFILNTEVPTFIAYYTCDKKFNIYAPISLPVRYSHSNTDIVNSECLQCVDDRYNAIDQLSASMQLCANGVLDFLIMSDEYKILPILG